MGKKSKAKPPPHKLQELVVRRINEEMEKAGFPNPTAVGKEAERRGLATKHFQRTLADTLNMKADPQLRTIFITSEVIGVAAWRLLQDGESNVVHFPSPAPQPTIPPAYSGKENGLQPRKRRRKG